MLAALLLTLLAHGAPQADDPAQFPGRVTPASPHYDLEVVYHERRFEEGLRTTNALLADAPDPVLYWMKARFMYEVGELTYDAPQAQMESFYEEMLAATEAGLELAPGDPHLRFARGIAKGRLGTTRGLLASLFMADDIEADWLATEQSGLVYASLGGEEVLPNDTLYGLGLFYRMVPDWWIIQALAGTRGDLDRSLSYLTRAVEGRVDIKNLKELGVTQLCIGDRRGESTMTSEGKRTLRRALSLPATNKKEVVDHKHIQMLIDDPTLACAYSRDGQADLDRSKVK